MLRAEVKYREEIADANLWIPEDNEEGFQMYGWWEKGTEVRTQI